MKMQLQKLHFSLTNLIFASKLSMFLRLLILTGILSGCSVEPPPFDIDKRREALESNLLYKRVRSGAVEVIAPSGKIPDGDASLFFKVFPWMEPLAMTLQSDEAVLLANSDENRLAFLKKAFSAKPPIVWALRGGYGVTRIVQNFSTLPGHKILIGYSDLTAFHLFLSKKWGRKTIHGPVAIEAVREKDPENWSFLAKMISKKSSFVYGGIKAISPVKKNKIEGSLTGGNITLVTAGLKTAWEMDAKDKIVLLEDVGTGYMVDRDIQHLVQSKTLHSAKAVIVGHLDIKGWDQDRIVSDLAKALPVPVFKCDFFGHGYKNYPWVYNAKAELRKRNSNEWELAFSNEGVFTKD